MRRLEVERIDEGPAQAGHSGGYRASPASAWVGAGDAAFGPPGFITADPVDGLRREPPGLVWRPRAVPRTHGTREAPGPRWAVLRPLCEELAAQSAAPMPADGNAAPGTEIATSGAPRGERVLARRAAAQAACGD